MLLYLAREVSKKHENQEKWLLHIPRESADEIIVPGSVKRKENVRYTKYCQRTADVSDSNYIGPAIIWNVIPYHSYWISICVAVNSELFITQLFWTSNAGVSCDTFSLNNKLILMRLYHLMYTFLFLSMR